MQQIAFKIKCISNINITNAQNSMKTNRKIAFSLTSYYKYLPFPTLSNREQQKVNSSYLII